MRRNAFSRARQPSTTTAARSIEAAASGAATTEASGALADVARCASDDLRAPVLALRTAAKRAAEQAASWGGTAANLDAGLHELLAAAAKARVIRPTSVHAARLQAVGAARDVANALGQASTMLGSLASAIEAAAATSQVTLADTLAAAGKAAP